MEHEKRSSGETQPSPYDKQLEIVRKNIRLWALELYNCESMLPTRPFLKMYTKLRENPKWYLRKELIDDCIRGDGCCARGCGCCQTRHTRNKSRRGIGHCTVEFGCCASNRGFEFTETEKTRFAEKTSDMLYDKTNPSYLILMLEAFFLAEATFEKLQRLATESLTRGYEFYRDVKSLLLG